MAAVTGVPVRVAGQLMDQLAVPAEGDLAGQFTRDVPLPRRRRGLSRLVGGAQAGPPACSLTTASHRSPQPEFGELTAMYTSIALRRS